ncbi:4'-phosphopantetheinyl transferase family protein, partial [Bifidobacterium breve]|uniref:4'-phosphopantetheinyl transferase family protein n=1 Tax=Bifidobacterium breve TaxID=1685 RepID=UPI0012ABAC6C
IVQHAVANPEVLISGGREGTRRVRLFDGERALVGNATAKRRREFTETRLLAHEALRRIGHDGPILKGSDGEPLWPSGIVGSLSHCPSLCAAAVASAERIRAVGVDVDDSDGLSDGIMRFVFSSEELASLRMASSVERRAAFCAKEAASKALYALDGTGTSVRYP